MALNRSEILRSAWATYRVRRMGVFAAGDAGGHRCFIRSIFAKAMTVAWAEAKKLVANDLRNREADRLAKDLVARLRAVRVARLAHLTAAEISARLSAVKDELQLLDYAPWGVRVADRRSALKAEAEGLCEVGAIADPIRCAA